VGPNLFQYASCLKLLNYPDRDLQHGGLRLVPEAAATLPRISPDGRTYAFRVRRGFRFYPSGKPVTAADFAWVLYRDLIRGTERELFSPEAATLLADIVGAKAVMAGGPRSALRGVRVAGSQLTIRLVRPVADFAARLASSYLCALPTGTPTPRWGIAPPIPSAGPYYIASIDDQHRVVLRRNPVYRGSRPHRFETIRGRPFDPLRPGANDVEVVASTRLAEALRLRDPKRTRLVGGTRPLLSYVALNWNRPLFHDHPRLARAVAYALDRPALIRAHAPSAGGIVTDRMLPSPRLGKPLYPLRPNLAHARALAAGQTGDGRVSIATCDKSDEAAGDVVAANLRAIGLTPTVLHFNCAFAMAYPIDTDVLLTVFAPAAASPGGVVYDAASYLRDLLAASPFNHGAGPKTNVAVPVWTARLTAAARLRSLAMRDRAAARLDRELMRAYPPLVPYMLRNDRVLLSSRVGCFAYQPVFGPDLGAVCPRY
jgi:ABC-type oligopeptide transport system substrate-binding subunit